MYGIVIKTKKGRVLFMERIFRGTAEFTASNAKHAKTFFSVEEAVDTYRESQGNEAAILTDGRVSSGCPSVVKL